MRKNQRRIYLLLISMLIACAALFAACVDDTLPDNSGNGVAVTLIVLDLDGTLLYEKELNTRKSVLYDAFNEFGELQIRSVSSISGAFVQSVAIGEVVEDENEFGKFTYFSEQKRIEENYAENRFIAVYHDIDDPALKYFSVPNLTHRGTEYFSSGVGVSLLPLNDGATYILKLETY